MHPFTILLIEDESDLRLSFSAYFRDMGYQVVEAENGMMGLELLRSTEPDLVFTDLRMPLLDGFGVIEAVTQESPATPVIVISGTGEMADAIKAMRMGARDFVMKPVYELEELDLVAKRALQENALQQEVDSLTKSLLHTSPESHPAFSSIITADSAMQAIFTYLATVAVSNHPVLVLGETGTGKELLAQAIHLASGRPGRFVAVNVAGLDDTLLGDALFGHVKGAFTGADKPRDGLITQARNGTLFLDEIGDLSPASQVKLLRLLQEREYYPIGADYPLHCTARIIVATHASLEALVKQGRFRLDLYYRLKIHQVQVPPLRERLDDLPLLLDHFIEQAARDLGKKPPAYPPELLCYLAIHSFPGNVRELQGLVFDAVARHTTGILSMQSFTQALGAQQPSACFSDSSGAMILLREQNSERMPTLEEAERVLIAQALRQTGNNQGAAALLLDITRNALNKKLIRGRLKY